MSEQDPELEAFSKFIAALDPRLGRSRRGMGTSFVYRLDPRASPPLRQNSLSPTSS
jgi:hypothetical protein